jgi:hypothetical protein
LWFKGALEVVMGFTVAVVVIITIPVPTVVSVVVRVVFLIGEVCLGAVELLLFFVSGDRRL